MARKRVSRRGQKAQRRRSVKKALSKAKRKPATSTSQKTRAGVASKRSQRQSISDRKLQLGLRFLRTEKSVASAAHKSGISAVKLRTYAIREKLLVKRGKHWIVEKNIPRNMLIYSDGTERIITVAKFRTASRIGEYMAGVRWFVQTNDQRHLEPFVGKSAKNASGNSFPFETRPNVLHRLAGSGGSSFEDVYRLVI
jgi:hypothetical protein